MPETVFLAGATGAIGKVLAPRLIRAGYTVFGTTRRADRVAVLIEAGVVPVVVDVFDADALTAALAEAKPDIVIHQLTDLPFGLDPAQMAEGRIRNARLREVGTANLVNAASKAGAGRMISQSIAWVYQPGNTPHREEDPLQDSAQAIMTLERLTLRTSGIAGTVLRYGALYGPATGADSPSGNITVHVDDAAEAALLAVRQSVDGIFNIVEDSPEVSNEKARSLLGWRPSFGK
ncbi:MAG: NAD(P)-dependent oxidoreductase [Rhizobiaceae bacterium]|nr:NAD(P)-dependent oxidoreductase [Rhizobiaceae bacterium]